MRLLRDRYAAQFFYRAHVSKRAFALAKAVRLTR